MNSLRDACTPNAGLGSVLNSSRSAAEVPAGALDTLRNGIGVRLNRLDVLTERLASIEERIRAAFNGPCKPETPGPKPGDHSSLSLPDQVSYLDTLLERLDSVADRLRDVSG